MAVPGSNFNLTTTNTIYMDNARKYSCSKVHNLDSLFTKALSLRKRLIAIACFFGLSKLNGQPLILSRLIVLFFWGSPLALFAQNLLSNPGFESYAVGTSAYLTSGSGNVTGNPGFWQLSINGSNPPNCTGNSCGTSSIVDSTFNTANHAMAITILKHSNRNDIRLFQVISGTVPPAKYVLTFWMRADVANVPVRANVFKSTEGWTTNGAGAFSVQFITSSRWQQCKMYIDISSWTEAQRTNMRISIGPNSGSSIALPTGPYPKTFWFDDFSFNQPDNLTELRDVAVQVASDRRYAALQAGFLDEANALSQEIIALKTSTLTLPVPLRRSIGFYPELIDTVNNLSINSINAWGESYLSKSFTFYPHSNAAYNGYLKAMPQRAVYPSNLFYDARAVGPIMNQLYWLLLSPHSKYQFNPILFRKFLLLIYATADDYAINGYSPNGTLPGSASVYSSLNDWFAISTVSNAWRMADVVFNAFLPPTILTQIKTAAALAGKQHLAWSQTILSGNYTNRDISYAEVLMNTGLHLDSIAWINMSKRIVDSVYLADLYPDGGYSYIKQQNESGSYHSATTESLLKIWTVSGYQPAWECVRKASIYELLTVEDPDIPEYYTAPAWKTTWNGAAGISPESIVYVAQNPWAKTKYNIFYNGGASANPLNIPFFNHQIKGKPLPDQYIVYDRNTQGPRCRNGLFSYGITTRNVSPKADDVGLQTLGGAMITKAVSGSKSMNAALMAVHPKVHVRKSANQEWSDWAYLSTKTVPRTCMSRSVAAVSTPSILQYQTVGPKGWETAWASFQQWITLPDRMICLLEVYPQNTTTTTKAYEIDARVRFTFGRDPYVLPQTIVIDSPGRSYRYGDLSAVIHDHNFSLIDTASAGVLRDDNYGRSKEIVFRYDLSNQGQTIYNYPASTRKFCIVEIKAGNTPGTVVASRIENGNLRGLVVSVNGKRYSSFRNLGTTALSIDLTPALLPNALAYLHFQRDDLPGSPPALVTNSSFTLAPNQQILVISGALSAQDTTQSWINYLDLLSHADPSQDSDGDGVLDSQDLDDDNDGLLDAIEDAAPNNDWDEDLVPNSLDLDSDNDGINDVREANGLDTDLNGLADGMPNAQGLPATASSGLISPDTDQDGRPDGVDLDSDNDGINDVLERGASASIDFDRNGKADGVDPDGDGIISSVDGAPNRYGDANDPVPLNTDQAGTPDYRDLDADNDGIWDIIAHGNLNYQLLDADQNGKIDLATDQDADGIPDLADGNLHTFADAFVPGVFPPSSTANGLLGIGTTRPHPSAALEILGNKGVLIPRLTELQIQQLPKPANGLLVFCSNCSPKSFFYAAQNNWYRLPSGTRTLSTSVGNPTDNNGLAIGTPSAHSSALLELTSTHKGVLIPQISALDSIAYPTEGLMVYWVNKGFYYFDGAAWQPVFGLPELAWPANSTPPTSSTLAAINLTQPDSSAVFHIQSANRGWLLPRVSALNLDALPNPALGLLLYCYDCTPSGFYFSNGLSWQLTSTPPLTSPPVQINPVVKPDNSLSVFFDPPHVQSDSITAYEAIAQPGNIQSSNTSSPISFSGLTPGLNYSFAIRALTTKGPGERSEPTQACVNYYALDNLGIQPEVAYGLRQLRQTYTGALIRIRRSSDNALLDVGFDAAGHLDTTALIQFIGTANGFVASWFDQSGQQRHASQLTAANQPQLVTNGKIARINGQPAIRFPLASCFLTGPTVSAQTVNFVRRVTGAWKYIFSQPAGADVSIRLNNTGARYGAANPTNTGDWWHNGPQPVLNGKSTLLVPASAHIGFFYRPTSYSQTFSISNNFLSRGMSGSDAVGEFIIFAVPLTLLQRQVLEQCQASYFQIRP